MKRKTTAVKIILTSALLISNALPALAADKKPAAANEKAPAQAPAATENDAQAGAEQVNVDAIKEKYWARGDESELGVVQNRLYSKDHKGQFGLIGGVSFTDPFLVVKTLGGIVGYNLSEYYSINLVGWKSFVSGSTALDTFKSQFGGVSPMLNEPRWFGGAELNASFLYGKLSLVGKKIIHYDMHLIAGAGVTGTKNGSFGTGIIGVGQQVYLSKSFALRLDYRAMIFKETLKQDINPVAADYGSTSSRTNFTNNITLGVSYFFGGAAK